MKKILLSLLFIPSLVFASPQIQDLDMQGYQCKNLGNGTLSTDAVNLGQLTSGYQPLDATLTALAAYNTNGLLTQTAADTFAGRTLAAPAAGFTITNPAGTAGNPTFVLSDDLAGLEGMSSTGIVARTGTGTYSNRTLQSASAGITWTNGDGVSGNPVPVLANDLAALEAMSGTGLVARTASETYSQRTVTAPAAGISISNGDGVSGNPTLALANDLSALEALASTGIAARTGTDTWAQRTVTGTTNYVDVANGSGVSGNPTISLATGLVTYFQQGWSPVPAGDFTFSSASAIATPVNDYSGFIGIGDKIVITQVTGGTKYFIVTNITSSVITVTSGNVYTVANESITGPAFSHQESPKGFPGSFAYAPTIVGFSVEPTNASYRFSVNNGMCHLMVRQTDAGTSNSGSFSITVPITAATITNAFWGGAIWNGQNNGAALTAPGRVYIGSAGTTITVERDYSSTAWTASGAKKADFMLWYAIK